jgi:hypothetical protein
VRTRHGARLVGTILLAGAIRAAGAAGRCKLLMSRPVPVRMEGLRPVISVEIDDAPARFIVDTGSFLRCEARAAADMELDAALPDCNRKALRPHGAHALTRPMDSASRHRPQADAATYKSHCRRAPSP